MGDHPTAVALFAGIVMALLHRERTGEGSMVATSLLANGLWSSAAIIQGALAGGDVAAYRQRQTSPPFLARLYRCADDRWIGLTMVRSGHEIKRLFTALGVSELLDDDRFSTTAAQYEHRDTLAGVLGALIAGESSDHWMARFAVHDVPAARAARTEEAVTDPQLRANAMVIPGDPESGVPWLVNNPVNVSTAEPVAPTRAPEPGEHSDQILAELGLTMSEIGALRADGVVSGGSASQR
jgi:formyl-CoA transferase